MQHETLDEQVQKPFAGMDEQNEHEPKTGNPGTEAADRIQDMYVLIVRERKEAEEQAQVVDSTQVYPQKISMIPAYIALLAYLFLILSTLAFQLFVVFNPPSATIYILTTKIPVTAQTTLTLPTRHLTPFTFTQTRTVKTTGHGHQAATQAHGYVTFYNALTQPQTIDAGTLLVGVDGEQVVTDETASIPAGDLSTNGQATVSAHAVNFGTEGNIRAGDMYGPCCKALIQVVNSAFSGGQNERDYQAVAKTDVSGVVDNLTAQFQRSTQTTVSSEVAYDETLITPVPCTTSVQSNHPIGAEAMQVTVSLQKTCFPVSYSISDLKQRVRSAFSQVAHIRLGSGYTLLGEVATSITNTAIRHHSVLLSVTCRGSWALEFNTRYLATLIAGRSVAEAKSILQYVPGTQHTDIQLEGLTDRIPKNLTLIHFVILYEPA